MRLQILGSGAAEAWPGIFCACETCRRARAAGGKNLRSRASVQIDGEWKIDYPPDTYLHLLRYGLDLSRLQHLFITHSHDDHFAWRELAYVRPPFGHDLVHPPLRVYGNATVCDLLKPLVERCQGLLEAKQVAPFVPVPAGHLTFTPLLAEHAPPEEALNYLVQEGPRTVLYASDTGLYGPRTMEFLSGRRLDLAIIECTQGALPLPATLHMGWEGVLRLRDDLAVAGSITSDTRMVITHFSHNAAMLHEELEALAGPEGVEVAYDGMELSV